MIPRFVHFVWLQGRDHLLMDNPFFGSIEEAWATYLPGFHQQVWDESQVRLLLARHPEWLARFEAGTTGCRTRVARFAILYLVGGVCADVDLRPIRDCRYLLQSDLVCLDADVAFFAAAPHHPEVGLQTGADWRHTMHSAQILGPPSLAHEPYTGNDTVMRGLHPGVPFLLDTLL